MMVFESALLPRDMSLSFDIVLLGWSLFRGHVNFPLGHVYILCWIVPLQDVESFFRLGDPELNLQPCHYYWKVGRFPNSVSCTTSR